MALDCEQGVAKGLLEGGQGVSKVRHGAGPILLGIEEISQRLAFVRLSIYSKIREERRNLAMREFDHFSSENESRQSEQIDFQLRHEASLCASRARHISKIWR